MHLRDHFAAIALQGMMQKAIELDWSWGETAQQAYTQADAMMRERKNWNFDKDPDNPEGHPNGYDVDEPQRTPPRKP